MSENANFASICQQCGLNFIGPPAESISLLGDKAKAKATAKKANCPVIPGSEGVVEDVQTAQQLAKQIGVPLLIKAVAGGGGKGIRIVNHIEELPAQFLAACTEAEASFGNAAVYMEKMILNPRHIEIQIIGDKHGHYAYLGERDCTIQRRRQKLIEESPSPILSRELRQKMGEAAVRIAKAAGYFSAGTVEFLLDEQRNFYFMEMNTRIQVEHTVTEEWTGRDLVAEQILIAQGKELSFKQKDLQFQGHVIQLRINAEDATKQFMPSPGEIKSYLPPGGPHVRVDSACYPGYRFPPYYDSMAAKLIVKGATRKQAIARAQRALREFHISGIKTTIPFHQFMLQDENFLNHDYNLNYVDDLIAEGCKFDLNL